MRVWVVGFGSAEETGGEHFVEFGGVDLGQLGGREDEAVVVVVGEAGVGEVGGASPDDFAVDDQEFVVH